MSNKTLSEIAEAQARGKVEFNKLMEMVIHDVIHETPTLKIVKVVNGWLYITYYASNVTSTFVPQHLTKN